ncbi:hypothetical protein MF271_04210 [Deinococcus sp. KNUC1210]|uniref:hypothetical protein n=1 Tax=Deinococcus sp. KNUC1210 TaxID=2917691 RepID=UPI001EEF8622|nr:hypothetical protein [Deinococcus sp. KNUC1210]ULH15847.1 hypothetical protein MF271_04210 [Deinococcus sp. KNUC1210]
MRPPPHNVKLYSNPLMQGVLWGAALLTGHVLVESLLKVQRAVSGWELAAYVLLLPVFVLMAISAHTWRALLGRAVLLSTLTFAYLLWAGLTAQPGFGGR